MKCKVDDCAREVWSKKYELCNPHYQAHRKTGEINTKPTYARLDEIAAKKEAIRQARANAVCTECGATFQAGQRGRVNVRCPGCRPKPKRSGQSKRCSWCGDLNRSKYKWHCSLECRNRHSYDRNTGLKFATEKRCGWCADRFLATSKSQRYCSPVCGKQSNHVRGYYELGYKSKNNWTPERQAAHAAREAKKRGLTYEVFSKWDVYERDNWTCQICQLPVPKGLTYPDPLYPSLDHIVPLAKGGPHTEANTQLAHLRCNILKSDNIGVC